MKNITYDYSYMLSNAVKEHGISPSALQKLQPVLKRAHAKYAHMLDDDTMAFHRLSDEHANITQIIKTAKHLKKNFETLVVIGIGGSDLGARAIITALTSQYHNELPSSKRKGMKIYFCGDTTDPQPLQELLDILNLKKTAFHVISKSGNTIETMSAFLILKDALKKRVGSTYAAHIVATTSETSGELIKLVTKEGYTLLPHGPVGGRFSVLSSVGLLSVACAGIDIKQLLFGADSLRHLIEEDVVSNNGPFIFAALHFSGAQQGKNMSVLMPYDYKLKKMGAWYRQLWAESLGKEGKGQTPVAALGPTDQHSQLQLYQEGPFDKQITFIITEQKKDLTTPELPLKNIAYFGKKKLSAILATEHLATATALMKAKKPNGTIILPELTPYYIGQLIYFFELATVYSGELYQINAFDQPGVEQSKNFLHALLGNQRLKKTKEEVGEILARKKTYLA